MFVCDSRRWCVLAILLFSLLTVTVSGPTRGGNSNGDDCRFPFVYKDVTYTECTGVDSDEPWCATRANYDRHKKWGYCQDEDLRNFPRFVNGTPNNVSTYVHDSARLVCAVKNLGRKTIQWHKRDTFLSDDEPELLFVGEYKVTDDPRLSVSLMYRCGGRWCDTDEYTPDDTADAEAMLIIDRARSEDIGYYRCQVIAKPPIRRDIRLDVLERPPSDTGAVIMSPEKDVLIHKGSELRLDCTVSVPRPLRTDQHIISARWFFDGRLVDEHSEDGLEFHQSVTHLGSAVVSTLTLSKVDMRASGTYVCESGSLDGGSVKVIVLDADKDTSRRDTQVKTVGNVASEGEEPEGNTGSSSRVVLNKSTSGKGVLLGPCFGLVVAAVLIVIRLPDVVSLGLL